MQKSDLEKYKKKLLELRARLNGEVDHLVEAIPEQTGTHGNLSGMPMHLGDAADTGTDVDVHVLHTEQGLLASVEEALVRIEDKTYGKCQDCGRQISPTRLEAIPYTPHCIDCAAKLQSQEQ